MADWLWCWVAGFVITIDLLVIFGPPPSLLVGVLGVCAVGVLVGLVVGVVRGRERSSS